MYLIILLSIINFKIILTSNEIHNGLNGTDFSRSQKISSLTSTHLEEILQKTLKETETLQLWLMTTTTIYTNYYIQWFLKQNQVPIIINAIPNDMAFRSLIVQHITKLNNDVRKNDHYAISGNITIMEWMMQTISEPTAIYFLILFNDDDRESQTSTFTRLNIIFQKLWKQYYISKIYLLYKSGIYLYNPFHLNVDGTYGNIIICDDKNVINEQSFHNLHGYPIRVQIFKSTYARLKMDQETNEIQYVYGVDGRVADLLQEYLNFTMILQKPNPNYFGEKSENGSYNGAIGALIRKDFDICLTGFFFKDYQVPEMDFSVALYDDKIYIYTQKAKRIPQSILPIAAVHNDLWLTFIFTPIICSLVWLLLRIIYLNLIYAMSKYKRKLIFYKTVSLLRQYRNILSDTWIMWMRANISYYPPFVGERIFIISVCLVSVIFGAVIESSLATAYIKPLYYKNIKTLKELDDSGMSILYKYASIGNDIYFNEKSPTHVSLRRKLIHIQNFRVDIFKDVAKYGGKAGLTRSTNMILKKLEKSEAAKDIWVIPHIPKYYLISYVWHKYIPWKHSINHWLLRFLAGGYFEKFINDMARDITIQMMKKRIFEMEVKFKVLTLEDLQLAFYVLFIGIITATVVLIMEMLCLPETFQ